MVPKASTVRTSDHKNGIEKGFDTNLVIQSCPLGHLNQEIFYHQSNEVRCGTYSPIGLGLEFDVNGATFESFIKWIPVNLQTTNMGATIPRYSPIG